MRTTIVKENGLRVVAELEQGGSPRPEHMGWPTVLISWERGRPSVSASSWDTAVDREAITRALQEFGNGTKFFRWLQVFAEDLIDWDELGLDAEDRGSRVRVLHAGVNGYSQGDRWTVLQWAQRGDQWSDWDAGTDELVNWARGDCWTLEAEEWDGELEQWDAAVGLDPSFTYYHQSPEESAYIGSEARALLLQAAKVRGRRRVVEAMAYYEDLAVTQ